MNDFKIIIFSCLIATATIAFIACVAFLASCKSAYPPCSADDYAVERCNGTVIEMCEGEVWHAIQDCDQVYAPNGEAMHMLCATDTEGTYCTDPSNPYKE